MKRKQVLSFALVLIIVLTLLPMAAHAEVFGDDGDFTLEPPNDGGVYPDSELYQINAKPSAPTPNGDGRTPYGLAWTDAEKGLITFSLQTERLVENGGGGITILIYRDGFLVGALLWGARYHNTLFPESSDYIGTHTVDISKYMDVDGEYTFIVQPPTDAGENGGYTGYVISAPYRKGAAPAPLNLPIRKSETIAYGRAIKTDGSLWNWTSGKMVKDMSDAAAVAVYSSSAAAIKQTGRSGQKAMGSRQSCWIMWLSYPADNACGPSKMTERPSIWYTMI